MTNYHFKNLVFEGGGVKGAAYVGALQVLESKGILENIERVGGTSAGAINAVLIGLGFSIEETDAFLKDPNLFKSFEDSDVGFFRDTWRLINEFGWCKGDVFFEWISDRIAEKTGNPKATFADIDKMKYEKQFKSLYLIGTNLSTASYEVFSCEDTPDMSVADAARISMSIPLFFRAIKRQRKDNQQIQDIYVDGGVLNNYPVRLFDRKKYISNSDDFFTPNYYEEANSSIPGDQKETLEYVYNKETLGFRLDSKAEISKFRKYADLQEGESSKPKEIDGLYSYLKMMLNNLLAAQQSSHLNNNDWARTIYIDTHDVDATDFDLELDKKNDLVTWGKDGTEKFFAWYDDASKVKPNG
ncbi:MAG: patatin-like phospholipase family protein [Leptolyngbya sp. SIO3F4]|nr:patatin-like phospholipase family protein [Leptolyngbya sp. SIO3F4]